MLCYNFSVSLKFFCLAIQLLRDLNLVPQKVVVVFLLRPTLILILLIALLDQLVLGEKLLNLRTLLPIELVLEAFVCDLFLCLELRQHFLVFHIS